MLEWRAVSLTARTTEGGTRMRVKKIGVGVILTAAILLTGCSAPAAEA